MCFMFCLSAFCRFKTHTSVFLSPWFPPKQPHSYTQIRFSDWNNIMIIQNWMISRNLYTFKSKTPLNQRQWRQSVKPWMGTFGSWPEFKVHLIVLANNVYAKQNVLLCERNLNLVRIFELKKHCFGEWMGQRWWCWERGRLDDARHELKSLFQLFSTG